MEGSSGGTFALLNTIAWMESNSWDGRNGIVIMSDNVSRIENGSRFMGGAGAVALLVTPDAALTLEPVRSTLIDDKCCELEEENESEILSVDSQVATDAYLQSLSSCYSSLKEKLRSIYKQHTSIESFDRIVFHCPNKRLTFDSFHRLCHIDL